VNILGLTGKAGVGKSAVAHILWRDHGWVEIAVADVLKRMCQELFRFSNDQLWGASSWRNADDPRFPRTRDFIVNGVNHGPRVTHLTPRFALESLGDWARECHPDVLVEYMMRSVRAVFKQPSNPKWARSYNRRTGVETGLVSNGWKAPSGVVISDCRMRSEVDAIRAAGGRIVRVVRASAGASGTHQTETQMDGIPPEFFDGTIHNDSSIQDLEALVSEWALVSSRRSA
jgi:hypothetical protein